MKLLLLVPVQFISELLLVKDSFSMMFIRLTHDNQYTRSVVSLFLSFVTNSPVAEKALSGSADLVLIVMKAWNSFSRLFDLFFVASKRLVFFFSVCNRISSCAGLVLWYSPSWKVNGSDMQEDYEKHYNLKDWLSCLPAFTIVPSSNFS